LVSEAFGQNADGVRLFTRLSNEKDFERYLCFIWMDKGKRTAWQDGFVNLGSKPVTRTTYDALYRSSSLDGGKIKAFYDAYKRVGLTPSEVDHAFFVDRAAHMSVFPNDLDKAIAKLKSNSSKWPVETWRVRRTIANNIMAGNGDVLIVLAGM
jgi:hypothetical protein